MSKEIAQTVSGPKIAWLLAIVAAFAVLATLATQWRGADAALPTTTVTLTRSGSTLPGATVTYTATFAFNPSGSVATGNSATFAVNFDNALINAVAPAGTGTGVIIPANCVVNGTNDVSCTDVDAANWTDGTLVFSFTNPPAGGTIAAPTGCVVTDGNSVNCTNNATAYAVGNLVPAPPSATNANGLEHAFVFQLPIGVTCASDALPDDAVRVCGVADVVNPDGADIISVAVADTNVEAASAVTVTVNGAGDDFDISLSLIAFAGANGTANAAFTSGVTTKSYVEAELRHVDDNGDFIFAQEIPNNVRGSRHTACFVEAETAVGSTPGVGVNVGTNFTTNFSNQPPNAYNGPENVIPQSPTANDVSRFIGNYEGDADGASCVSWYSVGAGDQILTASYVGDDGEAYDVRWDNNGAGQRGLVKEWNVLEDSTITVTGTGITTSGPTTQDGNGPLVVTVPLYQSPLGFYDYDGTLLIRDVFNGSHVNSGGQLEKFFSTAQPGGLAGVEWSIDVDADCSNADSYDGDTGVTTLDATGSPEGASFTVIGYPEITISDFSDCVLNDVIDIEITGSEGDLGSGTGLDVFQEIRIVFTIPAPNQKQVFLAWAGQRIILEHDWRIPPGDNSATDSVGVCPFPYEFDVVYLKGSGPGNFLPGLNVWTNGSDEAEVTVNNDLLGNDSQASQTQDGIVYHEANESCISRVVYESEDQGQVDVEAFVEEYYNGDFWQEAGAYTKHAFVIYYMKLNTVTTTLVTQVEKPWHNANGSDWAGVGTTTSGNPWNSSLDDADGAAEWNVSKDILARVRVTGWFLTTNPSGRPADTSNPLNVLPANRWVMPDDWAQLNGGPIDAAGLNETTHNIGTAEEFRAYYDLMIAPNNAAGLALTDPEGDNPPILGVVAAANAGNGATATRISVVSCVSLTPGTIIGAFGTTTAGGPWIVQECVNNALWIAPTLAAAPAAGTLILGISTPFEGPYSLIDIPGLAAQNGGNAGAALSNWAAPATRDTTWADGDVDAWDAPMPPAEVSIKLRGTGFLKPVLKQDVYYLGAANGTTQSYPNPYYIQNIPSSYYIPAIVVGGGYLWDSWGNDGPGGSGDGVYRFWQWVVAGSNARGVGETLSTADQTELGIIGSFHGDVARDAVIYTDNHGEGMFAANGDFKTDLTACATNALAGGKHCAPGDKVGTATITATADYPDFRGKHFPVLSNAVTVDWLWGGYKDVTVHPGETDQFKYIVFHAMDRDGFCRLPNANTILLHPVLTSEDAKNNFSGLGARYNFDPNENVDFLIDSGEGIIIGQSGGGTINDGKQFATGVTTFSVAANNPAATGILEFPLSPLAGEGQTDECQAWIKVSNSLLGIVNVLTIAHDDEGNIGFDRVIDLSNTMSYTLNFRWSLITWAGADGISVSDALTGTGDGGQNPGGNDISASVTAIYGWDAAAQQWLGYFPSGVNVPGANDLTSLNTGDAYWIAITGPSSVTWTIATNIN